MSGRIFALLAAGALACWGVVACVDVPDNMRAEFAGPAPNDRSNYRQGTHGAAPANWTHFKVAGSYDAGTPDAAPVATPPAEADAGMMIVAPFDGGTT